MNNRTVTLLLGIALALAIGWGLYLNNELKNSNNDEPSIGICSGGLEAMGTVLDADVAHRMINTYKAFNDSLTSVGFVLRNHGKQVLIGEDEFAASFDEIFYQALSNNAFRAVKPCEFNTILKNAASEDEVYTVLAVNRNPENGKASLDLIYKVKASQDSELIGTKSVDADGYFYVDHHCPCKDPCCCGDGPHKSRCAESECTCCYKMNGCDNCPGRNPDTLICPKGDHGQSGSTGLRQAE